ncbi:MAG: hypothetical protein S4CHLAM7_11850 [Chlamydiae bacterium]|nr:hypothetical protein [Chlamydiota bacterium]
MSLVFFLQRVENKLIIEMKQIEQLQSQLRELFKKRVLDKRNFEITKDCIQSYFNSAAQGEYSAEHTGKILEIFLERLEYLHKHPFTFKPYHHQILEPFDYHQYGIDFVKPLVNKEASTFIGGENLKQINQKVSQGHNVILFANHQTELDPQFMSVLLEEEYAQLAKDMIFVAGDRVILDQLAIPMSMGRNLLCIYSKKHIENPPQLMEEKRLHNKKTMELMSDLLVEGGKCIYVAPSGGRDRPNANGEFRVSRLDPKSLELFYIMALKSKQPTDFYSLSLLTHEVMPPPKEVSEDLGEDRLTKYAGIYAAFGKSIDMVNFSKQPIENKVERRHLRSEFIWKQINDDYQKLITIQGQNEKSS